MFSVALYHWSGMFFTDVWEDSCGFHASNG